MLKDRKENSYLPGKSSIAAHEVFNSFKTPCVETILYPEFSRSKKQATNGIQFRYSNGVMLWAKLKTMADQSKPRPTAMTVSHHSERASL